MGNSSLLKREPVTQREWEVSKGNPELEARCRRAMQDWVDSLEGERNLETVASCENRLKGSDEPKTRIIATIPCCVDELLEQFCAETGMFKSAIITRGILLCCAELEAKYRKSAPYAKSRVSEENFEEKIHKILETTSMQF